MRRDLSAEQWHAVDGGELLAPDGTVYRRRTTRTKRRDVAELVESGRPVVVYWPGGGAGFDEVVWHDGDDARRAWTQVRSLLTSRPLDPRQGEAVTAGRWESLEGDVLLVLTWHH